MKTTAISALTGNELKKGEGVAVYASKVIFDENGRVKASPRVSNLGRIETDDIGFIARASQKLLGGRMTATDTETGKSPIYFEIVSVMKRDKGLQSIIDMIVKRLSYIIKYDDNLITFKSVKFTDLASYGKRFLTHATKTGLEITYIVNDTNTGLSYEMPAEYVERIYKGENIQHILSDIRNTYKTWSSACHTDN
jgi:hypothetical protein